LQLLAKHALLTIKGSNKILTTSCINDLAEIEIRAGGECERAHEAANDYVEQ